MRILFFMFISIVLAFSISGCNDSAKVDELTKVNAALSVELQECRESQKKSALREEDRKKEAEAFNRVRNEQMNKTKF